MARLFAAATEGNLEEVQKLLNDGSDINYRDHASQNTLFIAAHYGRTEVVKYLLECGADMTVITTEKLTPLYSACRFGYEEIVRLLLEKEDSKKILVDILQDIYLIL
jgi:ankyrin repeat protein